MQGISNADLIVAGARCAVRQSWALIKVSRGRTVKDGEVLRDAFGSEFPLTLGRLDTETPDPAGRIPAAGSSVTDVKAFLLALGTKAASGGFLPKRAAFWEKPGFVIWCAASADAEAEEARLAAGDAGFADAKVRIEADCD